MTQLTNPHSELPIKQLADKDLSAITWFCVACCGVSAWSQFAKLIMHCERNAQALEAIKRWRVYQTGNNYERPGAEVFATVTALIEEYKYANHK